MNTRTLIFLAILLLILLGGALWWRDSIQRSSLPPAREFEEAVETIEAERKVYENEGYGFSFTVPGDVQVVSHETGADISDPRLESQMASIQVIRNTAGEEVGMYEEFVLDAVRMNCVADAASISVVCTEIRNLAPFTTQSGVKGQVFYLAGERKGSDGVPMPILKGPFFTFNLSANTPGVMSFLLVGSPMHATVDQVDSEFVEEVAHTVEIEDRSVRE